MNIEIYKNRYNHYKMILILKKYSKKTPLKIIFITINNHHQLNIKKILTNSKNDSNKEHNKNPL